MQQALAKNSEVGVKVLEVASTLVDDVCKRADESLRSISVR